MSMQFGNRQLAARFMSQLQLPIIAGPMFLISGPDLVIGCCNAGVVGSFPSLNARTTTLLDEWLTRIAAETSSPNAAPYAVNMIVHPSRSEEHTSELQSLMRISYAVFCLKKKKHKK